MPWISVAVARQSGLPLPPVDLVRLGDFYYVGDSHHRISAARSLGEKSIDARIVIRGGTDEEIDRSKENKVFGGTAPIQTPAPSADGVSLKKYGGKS